MGSILGNLDEFPHLICWTCFFTNQILE